MDTTAVEAISPSRGHSLEDLSVGMSASLSRSLDAETVRAFAAISGDCNPIHLDQEYAATTRFGGTIAHGMLTAALITGVLGSHLPGPGCIYLSQTVRFTRPVMVGKTVTATCTVAAINAEKRRVRFDTRCEVEGKVVLEGEAEMLVPVRSSG